MTTPQPPGTDPTAMSNAAAIRLVAGREMSTRLHSKAFRIVTLVLVIVVVALCVVLKIVSSTGGGTTVAYTPTDRAAATQLPALAASVGQTIKVEPVADRTAGERQVRSGDVDALLAGNPGQFVIVVKKDIDANLRNIVNVLASQVSLDQQIARLGGDPAQVHAAASRATAKVQPLQKPFPYQPQQLILGIVAGILIYMSLLLNGQAVAQGVVEEKSSRVVELLLATIRPWQLMTGKVLGIGVMGLLQVLVIAVAGVVAGLATGVLTISLGAAVGTIVWLIVWYLLGFFMYAVAFAGLGALVSRQEDVGSVVAPALMFLIAGYVLGISILPSNPGSQLMEVLSVIPVFAPTVMPMRLAMGGVAPWEAIVSIGLVAILIPILVYVAARIYRNAVLQTGARVKLSHALRPA